MNVLWIDPEEPDPDLLARVARLLQDGEVVAGPSDTVYGFLALARSARARKTLEALKERPGPFLLVVSGFEEARTWTRGVREEIWERLGRIWPGPVTVILPTENSLPGGESGGIALRMPRSNFLERLLHAVGEPLFSTSANPPGAPAPTEAAEVARVFGTRIPLILDGGRAESEEPSTLVDLSGNTPRVVRKGRGDPGPLLDPGSPPP